MQLDKPSLQLLDLLLRDGRLSVPEMALCLHQSEDAVRDRLDHLKDEGILRGFHADVDPAQAGLPVSAIVEGTADVRRRQALAEALAKVPNVVQADAFSEDQSIRIRVLAQSPQDLPAAVQRHLAPLELGELDTRVVLQEIVPPRPPRLEEMFDEDTQPQAFPFSRPWPQTARSGPVAG